MRTARRVYVRENCARSVRVFARIPEHSAVRELETKHAHQTVKPAERSLRAGEFLQGSDSFFRRLSYRLFVRESNHRRSRIGQSWQLGFSAVAVMLGRVATFVQQPIAHRSQRPGDPFEATRMKLATSSSLLNDSRAFENNILSRIHVEPPYNALFALEPLGESGVLARVNFESEAGLEHGGISSAEIGRHMAILGSCVLARRAAPRSRNYYLAKSARIERVNLSRSFPPSGTFKIQGVPVESDDKSVDAVLHCTESGLEVARLRCSYQKLSDRLFGRLFSRHRLSQGTAILDNPYRRPIDWCQVELQTAHAWAKIEPVSQRMCVGHFRHYPAFPVARLMECINRLACEHLESQTPLRPTLHHADIRADRLAFSGERLTFRVEPQASEPASPRYIGMACDETGAQFACAEFRYALAQALDS